MTHEKKERPSGNLSFYISDKEKKRQKKYKVGWEIRSGGAAMAVGPNPVIPAYDFAKCDIVVESKCFSMNIDFDKDFEIKIYGKNGNKKDFNRQAFRRELIRRLKEELDSINIDYAK